MTKYTFFWSGDDVLSNFYLYDYVDSHGKHLCCSEQGYMYNKAMYFGDHETAEKIMMLKVPKYIKAAGQLVKNFNREDWDNNSCIQMFYVCLDKFKVPELKEFLLSTGDSILVEASPYDRKWGIGYSRFDAIRTPKELWGENRLGKVLMKVRNYVR